MVVCPRIPIFGVSNAPAECKTPVSGDITKSASFVRAIVIRKSVFPDKLVIFLSLRVSIN